MRCPDLRIFPKNIKFKRIFFVVIVLLVVVSAYFIISLPDDPRKVNIAIDIPAETEALPFDVVYRSNVCKDKYRDSNFNAHYKDGSRYVEIKPKQRKGSSIYEENVSLDDGGYCKWKLSNIRLGFRFKRNSSILNNIDDNVYKKITIVFDNNSPPVNSGNKLPEAYGDLIIEEDYYPLITSYPRYRMPSELFIRGKRNNILYKLNNPEKVFFKPNLHSNKVVRVIQSMAPDENYKFIYPDGTVKYADLTDTLDFELLNSME